MVKEVEKVEFEQLAGQGRVLVDFFSSTCGPCKMLSFVLNDVDRTCGGNTTILKVDFDKNQDLVEQYGVSGYPTLILLQDGVELNRVSGLQQKPFILKMIGQN